MLDLFDIDFWVIFGFIGSSLFFARWVVQFIHAKRVGKSEVPKLFWVFSVMGATMLLVYAIHRLDPVFMLTSFASLVIYAYNIYLLKKK